MPGGEWRNSEPVRKAVSFSEGGVTAPIDPGRVTEPIIGHEHIKRLSEAGYRILTEGEYQNLTLARKILEDLDRCEHGRHEGDDCASKAGCDGPSKGNGFALDRRIGTTLYGQPITIPEDRRKTIEAKAWYS